MKRKALSLWSKVLAALLALFGITSCEDHYLAMYACAPAPDYRIKGTVTDTASNPIPDIRVTVEGWRSKQLKFTDTLFTDSLGIIDEKNYDDLPLYSDSISIKIDDIDGEENGGVFQSEVINPKIGYHKDSDGIYWEGVEFNVTLKKK